MSGKYSNTQPLSNKKPLQTQRALSKFLKEVPGLII
jgi:hypothetical protein